MPVYERVTRSTARPLGVIRLGVALSVVTASAFGIVGLAHALTFFDGRATSYASLTYQDRIYGYRRESPNIIRDREVVEHSLATMPRDATYRVVMGPRWRPAWRTRWSDELEADFLRYFLLPRQQTDSRSAEWLYCFACDVEALGAPFQVLFESRSGLRFGRIVR